MMGLGFYFIAFFGLWFYRASRGWIDTNKGLLWFSVCMLPLPWVAIESGWFIAEFGRQPWVVEGVLPTFYAASGLKVSDLVISLGFFTTLYSILFVVMVILMRRIVRAGPKDKLLPGGEDDEDFVIAALPANAATKEMGS
jgi:cytochrome d ubiquinol oxidase subunit I